MFTYSAPNENKHLQSRTPSCPSLGNGPRPISCVSCLGSKKECQCCAIVHFISSLLCLDQCIKELYNNKKKKKKKNAPSVSTLLLLLATL